MFWFSDFLFAKVLFFFFPFLLLLVKRWRGTRKISKWIWNLWFLRFRTCFKIKLFLISLILSTLFYFLCVFDCHNFLLAVDLRLTLFHLILWLGWIWYLMSFCEISFSEDYLWMDIVIYVYKWFLVDFYNKPM